MIAFGTTKRWNYLFPLIRKTIKKYISPSVYRVRRQAPPPLCRLPSPSPLHLRCLQTGQTLHTRPGVWQGSAYNVRRQGGYRLWRKRCLVLTSEFEKEVTTELKSSIGSYSMSDRSHWKVFRCQSKLIHVSVAVCLKLLYSKAFTLTDRL